MTNKEKAIELLKRYKLLKVRSRILEEKLIALENLITSARGVTCSTVPNRGGSSKYEDKLIDYITRKDFYKLKLAAYAEEIAGIERAIAELPEREKTTLKVFFLDDNAEDRVGTLSEILGFERSHIYRIREKALNRLATIYYARYA
ncbi:MAG TPA: hypothetical protein PK778_01030 [Bacillota bacterium]|nr:hypothetical protein [Clostridiales bacterium]HPT84565.1 hypothetical protein [Bacillota bacterium]